MKIFHAGTPTDDLLHLEQLAECFGIRAELIDVQASHSLPEALAKERKGTGSGWVLDLSSLKSYLEPISQLRETADILLGCDAAVLLLVMDCDKVTSRALEMLTGEGVAGVRDLTRAESMTFPESGSSFSRELSSQTFPRGAGKALTLTLAETTKMTPLMELDGAPSFAHRQVGPAQIFVWSATAIFDVRRPLQAETEFELACDEYIPAIIFLRAAFGDQCWHNPTAGAGIIIDDPLLTKKYGFIDFEKLLESARTHAYHVTLAFIPWNQWRSRVREVKLFLDYSDCFSICVHGCDHTRNEYGQADYHGLLRKNFVARERMERHGRRTGLECESIMVCPQEKYSLEAMKAFSDSRQFQGVVCTACMPRNLLSPQISGADLLLPAQDSFFGFPVFKRHYSGDPAVFAMALFLGKPAILVEHHEFFRDGPSGAEDFARFLSQLHPDLKWRSLTETLKRTHARRRVSANTVEVRFFTDEFILEHPAEEPVRYCLSRRVPAGLNVEQVLVRGEKVKFSREKEFVRVETQMQQPDSISVEIKVAPTTPSAPYPNGIKYQTSVAFRRGLSELRDKFISRNDFALKTGRFLLSTLERKRASRTDDDNGGQMTEDVARARFSK